MPASSSAPEEPNEPGGPDEVPAEPPQATPRRTDAASAPTTFLFTAHSVRRQRAFLPGIGSFRKLEIEIVEAQAVATDTDGEDDLG
jgi:hypothetical protein